MKDIPGYEGLYAVTIDGRVWSYPRPKIGRRGHWIKSFPDLQGYLKIFLTREGSTKTVSLHRVLAQAFLPNPNNLGFVNHKSGIKADNRIENLEWVTASENTRHAYKIGLLTPYFKGKRGEESPNHKLTIEQVEWVRSLRKEGKYWREITEITKIPSRTARDIIRGRTW